MPNNNGPRMKLGYDNHRLIGCVIIWPTRHQVWKKVGSSTLRPKQKATMALATLGRSTHQRVQVVAVHLATSASKDATFCTVSWRHNPFLSRIVKLLWRKTLAKSVAFCIPTD
ncbi:hypothetical protein AAZV13_03G062350 [Glycine max]